MMLFEMPADNDPLDNERLHKQLRKVKADAATNMSEVTEQLVRARAIRKTSQRLRSRAESLGERALGQANGLGDMDE